MSSLIYVSQGNEVEPLVDYNSLDIQLTTKGILTGSLVSLNTPDNKAHKLLIEESIVDIDGYEFRVKQLNDKTYHKRVFLMSRYYDLADIQKKETFAGTRTIQQWLSYFFSGTGWTYTIDFNDSMTIPNFGIGNVVELVESIANAFKCDWEIRRNNTVHFSRNLGGDRDKQYWYGYNVKALEKDVDTTKLKTYIEGYGANNVFASYSSPNISKFGKREADTIYDESYIDSNSLREYISTQIIDYPEVSFLLDSIELLDTELGEKVWLIYEPLDIEMKTRILEQYLTIINGELSVYKVTLGNKVMQNVNDEILDQKKDLNEEKKRTRSRFDQTDNRITLEVEAIGDSIATLEVTAEQISQRVSNNAGDIALVNVRADNIEQSVSNANGQIAALNIKADGIQTQVTNNNNNTQSSITQLSNRINLKVDVGGTVNDINVNNQGVQINANKINLNGAVIASGSITGTSTINVGTDLNVGRNIYMQGGGGGEIRFPAGDATVYANGSGYAGIRSNYGIFFDTQILDLSGANTLIGVAGSRTSGLGFGYSTFNKRLYVSLNGVDQGFIALT